MGDMGTDASCSPADTAPRKRGRRASVVTSCFMQTSVGVLVSHSDASAGNGGQRFARRRAHARAVFTLSPVSFAMASAVAFSTVSVAARRNARVSARKSAPVAALRNIGACLSAAAARRVRREPRVVAGGAVTSTTAGETAAGSEPPSPLGHAPRAARCDAPAPALRRGEHASAEGEGRHPRQQERYDYAQAAV